MAIKLYKKLLLANSMYYGHNYINCMNSVNGQNLQIYYGNGNTKYINDYVQDSMNSNYGYNNINCMNGNTQESDFQEVLLNIFKNESKYNEEDNSQYDNDGNNIDNNLINIHDNQDVKKEKIFLGKKRKDIPKKLSNVYIINKIFTNYKEFLIEYLNELLKKAYSFRRFTEIKTQNLSASYEYKEYLTSKVCDVIKKTSTKFTKSLKKNKNENLYNTIIRSNYDNRYYDIKRIFNMTIEEFYNKYYICKTENGTYDENSPFSNFIKNLEKDEDYKDQIKEGGYNIDKLIEKIKIKQK